MSTSRWPAALAVPTAFGGVLRLAHLAALAARDPLFGRPVIDAQFHAAEASRILRQGLLLPGEGAFYKGPLLSYVYALLFAMFGEGPGVVAMRVLNVALGTFAVFLVARIARRLGGDAAAWLAGGVAALYGTAIYYDATLLQPPLIAVLVLAAADRFVAARERENPLVELLAGGAFLALLTVTRGEGLLVAAGLGLWAALVARRGAWPGVAAARAAALVLVPVVLLVAPVTLRNVLVAHDPVLVSWNGGINLFMGNDPGFDQTSGNWNPDLAWTRLYHAPKQLGLAGGAAHQEFFLRQARAAARAHPGTTLALLGKKAALLLSGYEISNNQRIYEARDRSPVLVPLLWKTPWFAFPFGLAAPWIAWALVRAGAGLRRVAAPLFVIAGTTACVPVLFFDTARYRLPAIVVLLPCAAAACVGLRRERPSRGRAAAAWLAAALAGLVAAVTIPAHATLPPSDTTNLADLAHAAGRYDEELPLRERALREEPSDPYVRMHLADLLLRTGRPADALAQYRAVLDTPGLAADWINAATRSTARALFDLGRFDEAVQWYQRFLAAGPDRPLTGTRPDFHLQGTPPLQACAIRIELARALARAGRTAEAAAACVRAGTDCAESEVLAHDAQDVLRSLSSPGAGGR